MNFINFTNPSASSLPSVAEMNLKCILSTVLNCAQPYGLKNPKCSNACLHTVYHHYFSNNDSGNIFFSVAPDSCVNIWQQNLPFSI